jgi:hypothetical protein
MKKGTVSRESNDESLLQFALNEYQHQVILLRESGMSWSEISKEMGKDHSTIRRSYKRVQRRAAKAGLSPRHDMLHTVPDGYHVKGVSTLYKNGEVSAQWVKSSISTQESNLETLIEKLDAGKLPFAQFKPSRAPAKSDSDLLSLLTITDFHVGMYAWEPETGDDWDIKKCRDVFLNAINDGLNGIVENPAVGVLCQLGDFLHYDSILGPYTPMSKHQLDSDSRYGKLVDMSMTLMCEAVKLMLKKFERVIVVSAEGNHDLSGSLWLRKFVKHMFANDPRVEVIDNEFPFYAMSWGKNMLGFHHGHKVKMNQLQKLFSSEPRFRRMWGNADQAYIHTGHYHHERVIEDGGAIAEQHPTLAARDSFAARHGLASMRGAKIITYDKNDGEVHRVTVRPRS